MEIVGVWLGTVIASDWQDRLAHPIPRLPYFMLSSATYWCIFRRSRRGKSFCSALFIHRWQNFQSSCRDHPVFQIVFKYHHQMSRSSVSETCGQHIFQGMDAADVASCFCCQNNSWRYSIIIQLSWLLSHESTIQAGQSLFFTDSSGWIKLGSSFEGVQ